MGGIILFLILEIGADGYPYDFTGRTFFDFQYVISSDEDVYYVC